MWTSLLILWSIPLVIALVVLARAAEGNPAITNEESQLIFGDTADTEEMSVSPSMALKFALFATIFFGIGILQGLVFVNLGTFWSATVPLMTGIGAMLLLVYWVRSGARENRHRRQTAHSHRTGRRIPSLLSR
jgi:hypothetical protein